MPNLASGSSHVGGLAADRLRNGIERVERLEEEKKAIGDDIKDVFAEMKSAGFDVKVMKATIRRRKQEREDVETEDAVLATYEAALAGGGFPEEGEDEEQAEQEDEDI